MQSVLSYNSKTPDFIIHKYCYSSKMMRDLCEISLSYDNFTKNGIDVLSTFQQLYRQSLQ